MYIPPPSFALPFSILKPYKSDKLLSPLSYVTTDVMPRPSIVG